MSPAGRSGASALAAGGMLVGGGAMVGGGGMGGIGGGALRRPSGARAAQPAIWERPNPAGRIQTVGLTTSGDAATPTVPSGDADGAGASDSPAPSPSAPDQPDAPPVAPDVRSLSPALPPDGPTASAASVGTPVVPDPAPVTSVPPAPRSSPVSAPGGGGSAPVPTAPASSRSALGATPSAGGTAAPTSAGALPTEGRATGLGIEARAIDLTASLLPNGAQLTGQLMGEQGVSFEGAAYFGTADGAGAFNAFTALYGTPALQNGTSVAPTELLTVRFTRPVRAVAFNLFAVQFDRSFVTSGLASDPGFTVRYQSGEERFFSTSNVQDPTLFRSFLPDPLWWVFENGGPISSFTVHAPIFFASRDGAGFPDVVGDLYLANLQVLDVPKPVIIPPITVPEPMTLTLVGLGLAAMAMRRRR